MTLHHYEISRGSASGGASSSEIEMSSIEGTRILPDGFEEFFDKESGFFFWVGPDGTASWDPHWA